MVWGKTCTGTGNCWLYNAEMLRYLMNFTAAGNLLFKLLGPKSGLTRLIQVRFTLLYDLSLYSHYQTSFSSTSHVQRGLPRFPYLSVFRQIQNCFAMLIGQVHVGFCMERLPSNTFLPSIL